MDGRSGEKEGFLWQRGFDGVIGNGGLEDVEGGGGSGRLGRVDLRERRGAEMEGILGKQGNGGNHEGVLAAGRFDAETDGVEGWG